MTDTQLRLPMEMLEQVPDDLHIHGWALVAYASHARLDSMDSTHWWREAMKYRTWFPWLTYGECLEIAVKKIERMDRMIYPSSEQGVMI